MNYSSYSYYPLSLSDDNRDGIECVIRNVSQTLLFSGIYEYVPQLIYLNGYLNARIENISIELSRAECGTPGQPLY